MRKLMILLMFVIPSFSITLGFAVVPSHAIQCGEIIGAGANVTLDQDLDCRTYPALTINGPATLNMNGHTVKGNRYNDGLVVTGEGAKILNGTVEGFRYGVVVSGKGYHQLLKITARKNRIDGFFVASDNNKFVGNIADGNYGDGFEVDGDKNRLVNNTAVNNNDEGYEIDGKNIVLVNNYAANNRTDGIEIDGSENKLVNNKVTNDRDDGFVIDGENNVVHNNKAYDNTGDGIEVRGHENVLTNNKTTNNGDDGIDVLSNYKGNTLTKNKAKDNASNDLEDDNYYPYNEWSKNKFGTSNRDSIE